MFNRTHRYLLRFRFLILLESAIAALVSLLERTIATIVSAPAATTASLLVPITTLLTVLVLLVSVALHLLPVAGFDLGIFFHHVNDLVGNSQIFDCAAADVALGHTPKSVTILKRKRKEGIK